MSASASPTALSSPSAIEPAAPSRPSGLQSTGAGVMPLARRLGEMLDRDPIPELETVNVRPFRCTRRDIWPPEVWAEMEAIWKGEQP